MNALPAFLLARIADDERTIRTALAADSATAEIPISFRPFDLLISGQPDGAKLAAATRILDELAAKRAVVEARARAWDPWPPDPFSRGWAEGLDQVLRMLVQPYRDHPDFNGRWALSA